MNVVFAMSALRPLYFTERKSRDRACLKECGCFCRFECVSAAADKRYGISLPNGQQGIQGGTAADGRGL